MKDSAVRGENKMKKIWVNTARSFEEAEEKGMEFWQKAGVYARFSATWKMLEDLYKIRGVYGYKLRLRRSLLRVRKWEKTINKFHLTKLTICAIC